MQFRWPILLFLFISLQIVGQKRIFRGSVTDSLFRPLEFANIMAKPQNDDSPFVFGITDENGSFQLYLKDRISYLVNVSFMGFKPVEFEIDSVTKLIEKRIVLKPDTQLLDEVVIEAGTPMKITKDSIVYDVKHFVTGKEFKLKSVLRKLPGVEVDRNGKISVMGKEVSQVFVEDKPFFGGNSELAVENLPANVIEKIQVVNDYNRVGFMKGLTDDQKMIINIKLKEGKKRFVFGDVEAGANIEKNYVGKANLFYYSPKTNLSYIGNTNDIGQKSLSRVDISRFDPPKTNQLNVHKNNSSLLRGFLLDDDFVNRKILFNALQWQQDFGKKWTFNIFGVSAKRNTDYAYKRYNAYLSNPPVNETISKSKSLSELFNFGKMNLNYKPSEKEYFDYSFLLNQSSTNRNDLTATFSEVKSNSIDYTLNENKMSINQDLNWYKKFNKKNIVTLSANVGFGNVKPQNKWLSENPILEALLPLESAPFYAVQQKTETKSSYFDLLVKYYFKFTAKHHLYFTFGNNFSNDIFRSKTQQIIDENNILFDNFINDYSLKVNDLFLGLQYRFKLFGGIFTPGMFVHQLRWEHSYTGNQTLKYLLLPQADFELQTFGEITMRYRLKANVPKTYQFGYNFLINSFNRAYRGNISLTNEKYHDLNVYYNYAAIGSKIFFNYNLSYTRKLNSVKNKFFIDETDTYISPVNILEPEEIFQTGFSFSKEWRKFYLKYSPIYSFNKFYEYVDNTQVVNRSNIFISKYTVGTYYRDFPEVELGLIHSFYTNSLNQDQNNIKVVELNPFAYIEYDFKGFKLKADYQLQLINEKPSQNNTTPYHFINTSLYFGKDEKPFGFEISCTNVLNTGRLEKYYQSTYLYSQSLVYKQPRIWMLRLHYKL